MFLKFVIDLIKKKTTATNFAGTYAHTLLLASAIKAVTKKSALLHTTTRWPLSASLEALTQKLPHTQSLGQDFAFSVISLVSERKDSHRAKTNIYCCTEMKEL